MNENGKTVAVELFFLLKTQAKTLRVILLNYQSEITENSLIKTPFINSKLPITYTHKKRNIHT